jgi:hypothetical protein
MSHRRSFLSVPCAAALLCFAACTGAPTDSSLETETLRNDSFSSAIRDIGFPCGGTVSSQKLDDSGVHWRVACGSHAYVASMQDGSDVCIEHVFYGDPRDGVALGQLLEGRCTGEDSRR